MTGIPHLDAILAYRGIVDPLTRGVHDGGRHGVAADAVLLHLDGGCLGQGDDAALGHSVSAHFRGDTPHTGGDADDVAEPLFPHDRSDLVHTKEGDAQVGADDLIPLFRFPFPNLQGRLGRDVVHLLGIAAGVVDQNINAAILLHHLVYHPLHLIFFGQVSSDGPGTAACLSDLRCHGLQLGGRSADHGDHSAFLAQHQGDGTAKPLACAGDDGDLIL